jgi:hypothetical protein
VDITPAGHVDVELGGQVITSSATGRVDVELGGMVQLSPPFQSMIPERATGVVMHFIG